MVWGVGFRRSSVAKPQAAGGFALLVSPIGAAGFDDAAGGLDDFVDGGFGRAVGIVVAERLAGDLPEEEDRRLADEDRLFRIQPGCEFAKHGVVRLLTAGGGGVPAAQ